MYTYIFEYPLSLLTHTHLSLNDVFYSFYTATCLSYPSVLLLSSSSVFIHHCFFHLLCHSRSSSSHLSSFNSASLLTFLHLSGLAMGLLTSFKPRHYRPCNNANNINWFPDACVTSICFAFRGGAAWLTEDEPVKAG